MHDVGGRAALVNVVRGVRLFNLTALKHSLEQLQVWDLDSSGDQGRGLDVEQVEAFERS